MNKYLIHVIDEISCHKKNNLTYQMIPLENDEDGNPIYISHNDAIYLVGGNDFLDAIEIVSNTIQIKDVDDSDISLSDAIKKSFEKKEDHKNDSLSTIDIDEEIEEIEEENEETEEENVLESYHSYNRSINTTSKLITSICQINREEKGEKWIELHKITFYAIEENKIMTIKSE